MGLLKLDALASEPSIDGLLRRLLSMIDGSVQRTAWDTAHNARILQVVAGFGQPFPREH